MNVQIVNETGHIVAYKDRETIDRQNDVLHSVLVVAKSFNNKFLLSRIPTDKHHALFAGKLGASAATFARENETSEQAAIRACHEDVGIDTKAVTLLGDRFHEYFGTIRRFVSTYTITLSRAMHSFPTETQEFSQPELDRVISEQPSSIAPSLIKLWQDYRDRL